MIHYDEQHVVFTIQIQTNNSTNQQAKDNKMEEYTLEQHVRLPLCQFSSFELEYIVIMLLF